MHTYIFNKTARMYDVGFFNPQGTPALPGHPMWHVVIEVKSEIEAQDWVNYLNGGPGRRE